VVANAADFRTHLQIVAPGNSGSSGSGVVVTRAPTAAAAAAGAGHGRGGMRERWARTSVRCVGGHGYSACPGPGVPGARSDSATTGFRAAGRRPIVPPPGAALADGPFCRWVEGLQLWMLVDAVTGVAVVHIVLSPAEGKADAGGDVSAAAVPSPPSSPRPDGLSLETSAAPPPASSLSPAPGNISWTHCLPFPLLGSIPVGGGTLPPQRLP